MTPTDEEILRRVQRGDRDAFLVLFDRYHSRVESYARRQMQNPEAARDIASETFLRAYRTVDNFRIGEISYGGYLYLICRRLMLTERTRNSGVYVRSLDEDPGELDDIPDPVPLPLDAVLSAERCNMLHAALDRLPPTDREIIHLAFERDLSRRDISAILSKPSVTSVTSHLHRAIQKLKAIIIEQGYFETQRDGDQRTKHAAR
ncbi:MAG TPA: sigma-70 family RNA polymerase sigma factor [Chthonomonadaceae bacterium]|nr:sigma-70 family RNA polymerase sigma factor [Chthonomonadaceae bacterium]